MILATERVTLLTEKARRATGRKEYDVARRKYQNGCLFKRGSKRKVWVARWREDVIQQDGSRGRIHRSVVLGLVSEIPTRRLALAKLDERLRPLNQGTQRPQSIIRLRDFVVGEWTSLALPTLKFSTQRGYRLVLGRHLLPYFGDWRLCDIAKLDVQQFIIEKFRRGLAWQTVRNCRIVLSSILDSALEYGYLAVNPARGVKFPPQSPRKEPQILTAESFAPLLNCLQEPYKTMVALATLTGLRVGELLALPWRAVNSETLHILGSVYEGRFQKPTSEKGSRRLPLGPVTRWLLESQRQRSLRIRPDDFVFPNRRGGPYSARNLLQRVLLPAAESAGIGRVGWHQLRHVHASLLHHLGLAARIAQRQLGHASVETTLSIYTHAIEGTHRRGLRIWNAFCSQVFPSWKARRKCACANLLSKNELYFGACSSEG